jgi:WD40 repeat protein
VRLWDVQSGRCLKEFHGHTSWVHCVSFSPDGRSTASSSQDATVRLWNVEDGQCLKVLLGHADWIWSFDFSSVSLLSDINLSLVSGCGGRTIRLWNVRSEECLKVLEAPSGICSIR